MELISIYSLTNHSQKNWGILLVGKINCSMAIAQWNGGFGIMDYL